MTTGTHMAGQDTTGGWPAGWVISLVAGVVAAVLGRWLGDSSITAAVLVGLMVFGVFGVLLGMFWTAPPVAGGDHTHHDDTHHDLAHQDLAAPVLPAAARLAPVSAPVTAPVDIASVPEARPAVEVKPAGLAGPHGGMPDPLQTIEGIGPVLEKLCHDMGIFHFNQIAGWGPGEVAWMDSNLKGFRGRVTRDKWVRQARLIGEIGLEAFQLRARANDY